MQGEGGILGIEDKCFVFQDPQDILQEKCQVFFGALLVSPTLTTPQGLVSTLMLFCCLYPAMQTINEHHESSPGAGHHWT